MKHPALRLDFAHRDGTAASAGVGLLACGVFAAVLVLGYQHSLAEQVRATEQRLDDLRGQRQRGPSRSSSAPVELDVVEVERANRIVDEIAVPWERLFNGLERAAHPKVALLAVQPEVKQRRVSVSGEARDFVAIVEYLERLVRDGQFRDVYLTDHALKKDHPERPVAFTVSMEWSAR
jgi:hypothetical protein